MGRKNHKKKREKEHSSKPHHKTFTGTLDITRSGIGYVVVEGLERDILVRPNDFNRALHGDLVKVKIIKENFRNGRNEGEVTEVMERRQTEFIGHIEVNKDFAFFIPDTDKPMPDVYVPLNGLNNAKDNDRVVVKMLDWKEKNPHGIVVSVMDAINENDLAMKEILVEAGFPLLFPEDVMEEAERLPDIIAQDEIKKRKDMRGILTFTIDPLDAKDFDDAISFRKLPNGNYEIGVHIADVSHYLEPETALDKEAYQRATSVYLPDRVLPMLPERISNELCSLRPHEDKLTFSVIFQISPKAAIKQYWIGKTVIHSNHRFTYEDVQEIIEKKEGLYRDEVLELNNLAQRFRKQRFKNGAINFSSQEVRFRLDEDGRPVGIVIKESKEAHQLIEEFMLLANRTVAENVAKIKLNKKPLPFPYRVHDQPDQEKLLPFIDFAKKFGHKFDTKTPEGIAESFNKMLAEVQGKPEQHVLEQLGIRTMAKAVYTSENIGHYGLGFEFYCHFTSPIRRYPDVMVHRIMEQCIEDKPRADKKMEEKCRHSSERERSAMEAERAAAKYKQVEYMKQFLGEEFDAVVSGVAGFGFWAETVDHKCEGLISITSLTDYDDFRLVETDYCLVGRRSGRTFRMGDKVRIKVIAANQTKRQLDYQWILQGESDDDKKRKKGRMK
ncbi:MAG: ribonuclease R [Chitinophagaceae bacterium]|nr:ribonuclease R [Chitinophagaceae bacterium]